jgi:hypothetical protein
MDGSAAATMNSADREAGARLLAYSIARVYAAALLVEHASWSLDNEGDDRAALAALRWCSRELAPQARPDAEHRAASSALALDRPVER